MLEPAPRWRPVAISGKQRKAMDRVGGAELILPWPIGLSAGAPALVDVRDATPTEHAAAEAIVGPACRAAGLVPVRSTVALLRRPDDPAHAGAIWRAGETMQHLVVLIIGRRWVHASTRRSPGQCWHTDPIEPA